MSSVEAPENSSCSARGGSLCNAYCSNGECELSMLSRNSLSYCSCDADAVSADARSGTMPDAAAVITPAAGIADNAAAAAAAAAVDDDDDDDDIDDVDGT